MLLAALQHSGLNALPALMAAECLCTKRGGLYVNPKTGDVNVVMKTLLGNVSI